MNKAKINKSLNDKKICIITHSFATGPAQELRDFLIPLAKELTFIEHPFNYSGKKKSRICFYKKGKLQSRKESFSKFGGEYLYYLSDFFLNFQMILSYGKKYDICFAFNNFNSSSSIILKKFGYFKKVIFFTVDYTPKRFGNSALNRVYHWMDRFCCYKADMVWNDCISMETERAKNNVDMEKSSFQLTVPEGVHAERINPERQSWKNRFRLIYMGHVIKKNGLDLVIDSLPEIIKKEEKVRLLVIGDGDYKDALKKKISELKLDRYVDFLGFVEDHKQVENIMCKGGIGLATYVPDKNSFTCYSDPGKPKIYMGCGLPVIISNFPDSAKHIHKAKAGIAIKYDTNHFTKAVLKLIDKQEHSIYKKNAIAYAKKFEWSNIFYNALDRLGEKIE